MFWEFWYLVASIYYWYWTCWSRLSEAIVDNCFCCMEAGVRRLRRTALNKRRSTRWSLLAIVGEAPVGNWLRTPTKPGGLDLPIWMLQRNRADLSILFDRPSEAERVRSSTSSTERTRTDNFEGPGGSEKGLVEVSRFEAPLRLRGGIDQPFRAPLQLWAGSSGHLERPCGSERARADTLGPPTQKLYDFLTSIIIKRVYIYIYIYICVFECQLWLNMRFILVFRRPGGRVLWERCPPTYDWGDIKHAKKIYRKRLPPTWTISYIAICIWGCWRRLGKPVEWPRPERSETIFTSWFIHLERQCDCSKQGSLHPFWRKLQLASVPYYSLLFEWRSSYGRGRWSPYDLHREAGRQSWGYMLSEILEIVFWGQRVSISMPG